MFSAELNHGDRYASSIWSTGAGADQDPVIFRRLGRLNLIIANHRALSPELCEVLDDIEDEGVVVIDYKDVGHPLILL